MKDLSRFCKRASCLVASLLFFLSSPAWAEPDPLYLGLPDLLPEKILEQDRFISFEQTPDTFRAPLGFSFVVNGRVIPPGDQTPVDELFEESFFANLPAGNPVRIRKNSRQEEVWDYPVGTRVAHLIRFRSTPVQIFELRVVQKRDNGTWAFGVYSPSVNHAGQLELMKYVGTLPSQYHFKSQQGQSVDLAFRRINLKSCQHCHAMNSPSRHQYEEPSQAGPCGFAPHNTELQKTWAQRYLSTYGAIPFSGALEK